MPFSATPSPFRLSRRNPSTRRSGPQFAPTPRFLLSQNATQKDDDLDVIDDDGPSETQKVARDPPAIQSPTPSRPQRDVIEDSNDGADISYIQVGGRDADGLPDDAIDSTPPEVPDTPGVLDAEFEALFAPVRDGNKRRRVGGTTPSDRPSLTKHDSILSSPPATANSPTDPLHLPDKDRQITSAWEMSSQRTPAPSARPFAPFTSTQSDIKTPFRSRPRFMLSSTAKPSSSQSGPKFKPDTPGISPPERRKPAFVLPRSPSPNQDAEDIPAPFSPSSRTLRRRGRNRVGVSNYIPGGMAAEVRGWILEMGTKRDQLPKPPLSQAPDPQAADALLEKMKMYLLTARIIDVSESVLSGCGSLAFLQAEMLSGNNVQGKNPNATVNIMVMGPSRSKSAIRQIPSDADATINPYLRKGDIVGIYRGLNWSLELGKHLCENRTPGQVSGHMSECGPSDGTNPETKEGWLIAMEWDLIETAP